MGGGDPARLYPPREGCVFCRIAAGREPARYLGLGGVDTDDRCGVPATGPLAFRNRLTWLRVMALVIPNGHASQEQLWTDRDLYLPLLASAVELGKELTLDGAAAGETPEGFRLVANFGRIAHQSQDHGHVHVISRPDHEPMPKVGQGTPAVETAGDVIVDAAQVVSAPWSVRVTLSDAVTQEAMWTDKRLAELVDATVAIAERESPEGYRLAADFLPGPGMGPPGLFVLGGGQLDLYA